MSASERAHLVIDGFKVVLPFVLPLILIIDVFLHEPRYILQCHSCVRSPDSLAADQYTV